MRCICGGWLDRVNGSRLLHRHKKARDVSGPGFVKLGLNYRFTTAWITLSYSKNTTNSEYSQRVIGGSPTGARVETGLPYLDWTLAWVIPRAGRPSFDPAVAPPILTVSACANPPNASNKARGRYDSQLDHWYYSHVWSENYITPAPTTLCELRHKSLNVV